MPGNVTLLDSFFSFFCQFEILTVSQFSRPNILLSSSCIYPSVFFVLDKQVLLLSIRIQSRNSFCAVSEKDRNQTAREHAKLQSKATIHYNIIIQSSHAPASPVDSVMKAPQSYFSSIRSGTASAIS